MWCAECLCCKILVSLHCSLSLTQTNTQQASPACTHHACNQCQSVAPCSVTIGGMLCNVMGVGTDIRCVKMGVSCLMRYQPYLVTKKMARPNNQLYFTAVSMVYTWAHGRLKVPMHRFDWCSVLTAPSASTFSSSMVHEMCCAGQALFFHGTLWSKISKAANYEKPSHLEGHANLCSSKVDREHVLGWLQGRQPSI